MAMLRRCLKHQRPGHDAGKDPSDNNARRTFHQKEFLQLLGGIPVEGGLGDYAIGRFETGAGVFRLVFLGTTNGDPSTTSPGAIQVVLVVILVWLDYWGLPDQRGDRQLGTTSQTHSGTDHGDNNRGIISINDVEAIYKNYTAILTQCQADRAVKIGLRALRDELYESMADMDTRPVELVELESGALPTTAEISPEGMV